MDFRFGMMFVLLTITKQTLQKCILFRNPLNYYSQIVQCQDEVISSNFHERAEPVIKKNGPDCIEIGNSSSPEIASGAFNTSAFARVPQLKINGAGVHVIQPGAFKGLKFLRKLSLKNNKITELQEHYFTNLTLLQELDLSFNNIANISDKCFISLGSLRQLILQNNFLTELTPDVFKNLVALQILDLSFNKLSAIDDKVLINLKVLETLFLNNNNINFFEDSLLSNNSLISNVYINNNYLTKLSNLSTANSLNILNASYNVISSLSFSKNTVVKIIDLTSNGITSIKNLSFKNLTVSELYLDRNLFGLHPIESATFSDLYLLEVISLADNQIQQLGSDLFKNNMKIKKINLAKNYLSDVSGLPTSLQNLNLSYNNFNSQLNLSDLVNMRNIDISFNKLTEVKFNFLKSLNQLFTLNLSNNKIDKISLGCFRDLKNLRELNLANNNVSTLGLGVFVGLDNLNRLDMSHNKLTVLNEGIFHNLRLMSSLYLGYNNLNYSSVENALSHIYFLRVLDVAGNGWSCNILINIIKKYRMIRFTNNNADYEVTNVGGIACKFEVIDNTDLVNMETKYLSDISSKLLSNNVVLILILIVLILKIILKYITCINVKEQLKNKLRRKKSDQELQIVDDY